MILAYRDFSWALQSILQSVGWFSTSSDLDHHLWQSKAAIPFPPVKRRNKFSNKSVNKAGGFDSS
jgi:hypothetical protein